MMPGQRGYSLIELVIFIVVVGLAVAAVLGAFTSSLRGVAMEDEAVRAAHLGQQRMELLLGQKRGGAIDFEELADTCDALEPPAGWPVPDGHTITHECVLDAYDVARVIVRVTVPGGHTYAYASRIHDLSQGP